MLWQPVMMTWPEYVPKETVKVAQNVPQWRVTRQMDGVVFTVVICPVHTLARTHRQMAGTTNQFARGVEETGAQTNVWKMKLLEMKNEERNDLRKL